MIVLDANVLIAHLDEEDSHHERASALLADVAADSLCASALTVAEVLVGPARSGHLDRAITVLDQLGVATQHLP
ncbi:MAG: type II toxin-antitoxin system VapC family toxin, partial [Candidatus Dormibacteria bacterium]